MAYLFVLFLSYLQSKNNFANCIILIHIDYTIKTYARSKNYNLWGEIFQVDYMQWKHTKMAKRVFAITLSRFYSCDNPNFQFRGFLQTLYWGLRVPNIGARLSQTAGSKTDLVYLRGKCFTPIKYIYRSKSTVSSNFENVIFHNRGV